MKKRHKVIVAFVVLMFGLGLLAMAGCNTVSGIARDIEALSEGTKDHLTKD